jgi:hypothetical protein
MTFKAIFFGMFVFLAGAVLILPLPGFCVEESGCVALVEKTCKECHSTARICRNLLKDRAEIWWKSNIDNMVEYGAEYTKEEGEKALNCLLKPYSEIKKLCE